MTQLKEPRKVDKEPIVKGEAYFSSYIRLFDRFPGIDVSYKAKDDFGVYFTITCRNEQVARSLAKLLRDVKV